MTAYTRKSANILLEAAELQERKGRDYQNPLSRVRQADHYPRGVYTILDTINGKMLRMYSVLETMEQGGAINFESVEDSAIDMINYASFLVAYMRGDIDGQEPGKDIFNRRGTMNEALIPSNFRLEAPIKPETNRGPFPDVVAQETYVPKGRFEE